MKLISSFVHTDRLFVKKLLLCISLYLPVNIPECNVKSSETVNILAIILGTIAGIVLIGLLMLIIWKVVVTGYVSSYCLIYNVFPPMLTIKPRGWTLCLVSTYVNHHA